MVTAVASRRGDLVSDMASVMIHVSCGAAKDGLGRTSYSAARDALRNFPPPWRTTDSSITAPTATPKGTERSTLELLGLHLSVNSLGS